MSDVMVNVLAWVLALSILGWMIWNYFRIKNAAHYVDNEAFKALMRTGQLIDIREPHLFRQKHILGARNFPAFNQEQFTAYLSALRTDKPLLIYDNSRSQLIGRTVLHLKKAGFTDVYVLRDGFDYWDGKIK